MPIEHADDVVFVPGDPPRRGVFALLHPEHVRGAPGTVSDIEVVVAAGAGARRRRVTARLVPLEVALGWLASLPAEADVAASARAWSVAVKAGMALVARGRLLPGISPTGFDAWRIGPLDAVDEDWLRALAAAFPPEGHALPLPSVRPLRVRSAEALLRECWDAIADTLARSPAALKVVRTPAFAGEWPVRVDRLGDWLSSATQGLGEGARPGLRLVPPPSTVPADAGGGAGPSASRAGPSARDDAAVRPLRTRRTARSGSAGSRGDTPEAGAEGQDGDGHFTAAVQLRSHADPSLVVDATDLWSSPEAVLRRLGDSVESDLLLALRRGARVWPPLGRLLEAPRPERLELDDDETSQLLGPAAEALGSAGLEVLWPAELAGDGLELRAGVEHTPQPEKAGRKAIDLDELLEFRWEVALGGELLTAEEVEALAEAKRPLIRLRGRWVTVDPDLLERLRHRRTGRLRAGEALAAILSGATLDIDGATVRIRVEGPLGELAERLQAARFPHDEPEPRGFSAELRPYQRRGLAWLAAMCELELGGCLADDMGLGKTIQVIALHLLRRPGRTLVVCPASLLGNWERELNRFAPDVPVRRYHGGGRHLIDLAPDEVVLTTYGLVLHDRAPLAEVAWDLAIADEAQAVKNPLSRTARELRAIPAGVCVALTGTPVENRLSDLWSILDWTTPGLLGRMDAFHQRIAVPVERDGDIGVRDRLAAMVRPFLLRRRKTDPDVAPELPRKTETDRVVPLTPEQATLYEAVVRESLAEIERTQGLARRGLIFKLLTALKQICNHPAHYLKQRGPLAGRSGKLAALDELLGVILDEGESALIFTQYVGMGRLLEAHLHAGGVDSLFLHGAVPVRQRDEMVAAFQRGAVPVFILSLKAGGVGLNLTRATHVLHYDRWWNPAVEDQATDRAYRIGQDRPVQVHRLVTEGTVEDRIAALLVQKRALAEAVVGAGEAWITELSNGELRALVSLRRD
jgi:superfamily II DNA or RNA helicase